MRGGRSRVVIEGVTPQIDGGRFPIKRVVGEEVVVEADIFTDGHDMITAVLKCRGPGDTGWRETHLQHFDNDRWKASFFVDAQGEFHYTLQAWIDRFGSWHRDLQKRVSAGQDVTVDLQIGAELIEEVAASAPKPNATTLTTFASKFRDDPVGTVETRLWDDEALIRLMAAHDPRLFATEYEQELAVSVDRVRARFSSWYEFFPRSAASQPGKHGTFADCLARLPYVAELGFNVVYFPPIHPIGQQFRKGRNNSTEAQPGDPGSPWAIGGKEGGHMSVHPDLGTLADFRKVVAEAKNLGIEIALDIAYQCAPDHPYVDDHPQWFRARPDGTIQYAENPPKKYQDIYPFDFETEDWEALWKELKRVVEFWIGENVKIFRVDNPHTKAFPFWEWMIGDIKKKHPDVLFLAEAFTRPKVMNRLAKLGFSQSYTYFTWRNSAEEFQEYLTELTQTQLKDTFRPNFWPNTPDILAGSLQVGGRASFISRLVLASTLAASYGIYGPVFELCEDTPVKPGSEEYLNSEKYEVRYHDLNAPHSLRHLVARINQIRLGNPALQTNAGLQFHPVDNAELLCYSKQADDPESTNGSNVVLVVVNLNSFQTQAGMVTLPLEELGLDNEHSYQVHDLLTDARYQWHGPRNYVELNPHQLPAHVFRIRRRVHSETEFENYL